MKLLLLMSLALWSAAAQTHFGGSAIPPQPSGNQPQGTGSISGKVVNGVTGEPIKNASVFAPGAQGKGARPTTDESGQFQLTGLPAMSTAVSASAQGYPGLFGMGMATHVVTLNAGESQSGVVLKLYPAGVITGRIVDDGGDAMSGCNVTAMQAGQQSSFGAARFGGRRGGPQPFGAGSTNDRGEYRLSNISAGRYILEAQCSEMIPVERPFGRRDEQTPPRSPAIWAPVFYPAAATPDDATVTVVLPGSEISGIDFQMHVAMTVPVRGQIAGSAGDQNAMSNCQLVPYNGPAPEPRMAQHFGVNPSTGAFTPLSVLPGNYRATCTRVTDQKNNKLEVGVADIHVGNEPPEPVTLQLSPGVPVEGVLDEPPTQNPQQQVFQQNGAANNQQQATVSLFPTGQLMFGGIPQANVDESGHFELPNVSPGSWTVNVQPRDFRHYVQSITWAQKPVAGNEIEIAPGESGPLRITMSSNVGTLNATIEGAPQSGAQLFGYAIPTDRKPDQQSLSPIGFAQGNTLESDHMRPGSYNVFVTAAPLPATEEAMELFAKLGKSVTITEGSQQSVTLTLLDNDALYQAVINSLQNSGP